MGARLIRTQAQREAAEVTPLRPEDHPDVRVLEQIKVLAEGINLRRYRGDDEARAAVWSLRESAERALHHVWNHHVDRYHAAGGTD